MLPLPPSLKWNFGNVMLLHDTTLWPRHCTGVSPLPDCSAGPAWRMRPLSLLGEPLPFNIVSVFVLRLLSPVWRVLPLPQLHFRILQLSHAVAAAQTLPLSPFKIVVRCHSFRNATAIVVQECWGLSHVDAVNRCHFFRTAAMFPDWGLGGLGEQTWIRGAPLQTRRRNLKKSMCVETRGTWNTSSIWAFKTCFLGTLSIFAKTQ